MESENQNPLKKSAISQEVAGPTPVTSGVRSLRELIDLVTGKSFTANLPQEDYGIVDILPFPFLALVGQMEMKLALLLAVINPAVGGVLLIGPRGTGKTTVARSLALLLPQIQRSSCFYGCMPEDAETGGLDAICPDCAKKYAEGKSLTFSDRVRMVELPLNSRLQDVIGYLDEHPTVPERVRLKRGILAQADRNILYVDEINLLGDEIVDAILDAAAQGSFTVKSGSLTTTYKSRFTLIGSMNPEEGNLRPQIMDRFGLRVIVRGLTEPSERYEAYQRVVAYKSSPYQVLQQYDQETKTALEEIQAARQLLPRVILSEEIARAGISLIQNLHIDSLRADITLFETARAYTAADHRAEVTLEDMNTIAPMALRLRRSSFITDYLTQQSKEEEELRALLGANKLPSP